MNKFEEGYCTVLRKCYNEGNTVVGRNGGTTQITAAQIRADLREGFPLVTGKKVFPKSMFVELEWLLKGQTNVKWLNAKGVKIWDAWADENGDLGPVYGHQIVNFNGINQLDELSKTYNKDKASRRLLVSMWNPADLDKMALPPCHYAFQFVIDNDYADIVVSMRSLDLFIGLPYDMGMYAALLHAFCAEYGLTPREVVINAANAHIYNEHLTAVVAYMAAEKFLLPIIKNVPKLSEFNAEAIEVTNYTAGARLVVEVKK